MCDRVLRRERPGRATTEQATGQWAGPTSQESEVELQEQSQSKRFAIAVSFPGEHRRFARNVVNRLAEALGRDRVFYDQWYEAELLGLDGDLKLKRYYRNQSELIVPFFSEHYEKPWCRVEWHAIRAMLLARRRDDAVVPVEMDGTRIEGWESIDFAIRKGKRIGRQVADLILAVYRHRHPEAAPSAVEQVAAPEPVCALASVSPAAPAPAPQASPALPAFAPRWSNELSTYGEGFAGREADLEALDAAWDGGATRVFALFAEGGAGKTRVLMKWLNQVRDDGWRGAGGVFVHSFYSQGNHDRRHASSEIFFEQALEYFGYRGEPIMDPATKGRTLAGLLVEGQGLLVLDGLEPLQHPVAFNEGRLRDPAIEHLFLSLSVAAAGQPAPALCVVTSRQPVVELRPREGRTVVQRHLDRLDPAAGAALLRQLDVRGTEVELRGAVDEYHGHAYSLMLLGSYLRDATGDHDIRRRREIPLLEEDEQHHSHAAKLFGAYILHLGENSPEVAALRLLGFFDRAAERELLNTLREHKDDAIEALAAPLADLCQAHWNRVLNHLRDLRLIALEPDATAIDSHPLLREYFAERLREDVPDAWRAGHRRLYQHLCVATEHQPDTLPGLQPLYQAVAHGCRAGLHAEARRDVYRDRILRGTGPGGNYSTFKLGAIGADLGAVACFFDEPWRRLSPNLSPADKAWLLNEAAFRLRALGRLTEAVEPMRAGLEMYAARENRKAAAITAGNLSELELTLGDVAAAVDVAGRSVTFADRSGDEFQPMNQRAKRADALYQAGRRDAARDLFEQAESLQAEHQPSYPRLYSAPGFRYCDLLLSAAERAVWQREINPKSEISKSDAVMADCDDVAERARQTLEWMTNYPNASLLDIALDHLTLARAGWYRASLAPDEFPDRQPEIQTHFDAAVDGLRQAGTMDHLPRGLLTRAWFRHGTSNPSGSREDLDEAEEIARRGPMPLYLADIFLTRARLFGRAREAAHYPWGSPRKDLAEAHRLIETHGYHRRDEELADAEAALREWEAQPRLPAPQTPPEETATMQKTTKTVVELDLVGYSTICDNLEQSLDVVTVAQLNAQIQGFVDVGLEAVDLKRDETVMQTTGDGAILFLDTAEQAHRFMEAAHAVAEAHNAGRTQALAKRVFRMGAAKGEVVMEPKRGGGYEVAGTTIARTVRLESKAQPGGVLIDEPTFAVLPAKLQRLYGDKQTIPGKRDEQFTAHPWLANAQGPADAEFFAKLGQDHGKTAAPEDLLNVLASLPTALFAEVVYRFDRKKAVSGKQTPQRERAIELLELAESRENGISELTQLVKQVRS